MIKPNFRLFKVKTCQNGSFSDEIIEFLSEKKECSYDEPCFFCTLVADNCPWLNITPSDTEGYSIMDVRVIRKRHQPLGLIFQQTSPVGPLSYPHLTINSCTRLKQSIIIHLH